MMIENGWDGSVKAAVEYNGGEGACECVGLGRRRRRRVRVMEGVG